MTNPVDKLKKIKGGTEIGERGEQAISADGEHLEPGATLADEAFDGLLDKSEFDSQNIGADVLFEKFYQNSETAFFPSFRQKEKTLESFRYNFGERSARAFIEKAGKIISGKFDLLGYQNLDFGTPVDWHFEPLSGKTSPKKHWKQFDETATDETGDKKIIRELNRHQHFFTLGVAYWLTKDERCAETFAHHLDGWMTENPPGTGINWSSSLEVALRAVSWIWAFHFFRDSPSLTTELLHSALKFLYLHGAHIEKYLSTYYSPNTHLTGEALGLYYLGTQLPFLERAAHWRKTGADILSGELDRQVLPDGVYFEQSTWHHRYTTDFYTHFQILRKLNESDSDSEFQEKLDQKLESLLDFLMFVTRPDGTTAFIGDDDGGGILPHSNAPPDDFRALLSTGAAMFMRGDYKFVARASAEETLWLLGAEAVKAFDNLPEYAPDENSRVFKDGGFFVMRDGWAETDNYMLVNCGELDAGHGHADALAVDAAIGGKTVLVDSGTYTYYESEAARNYYRSTDAHNTLIIDGKTQSEPGARFGWKTKARTSLHQWISQDRFDFFEGAHNGYERFEATPATHARGILFLKNDYWIIRDFVKTRGEHDYALNFHFNAGTNPTIENTKSGNLCVGEKFGAGVGSRLFTFGDNGNWQQQESPISPVFGKSVAAPFFKFVSKGTGAQEFFTFLMPQENNFAAPDVFETALTGGRAFVVKYRRYTDIFVFSDGEQIVRTELFNTNFRFFWTRLSEGENLPEEFVLINGTNFSLGNREIINQSQTVESATARRFGDQLNVRTTEDVFSLSLTPENH